MRWTIRRKLTAWIATPLLLIYSAVLVWDFRGEREGTQRFMQQLVMDRASQLAGLYGARLQWAEQTAQMLAGAVASRTPGRAMFGQGDLGAALRQNDWIAAASMAWQPEGETQWRGLQIRRSLAGMPRPEPLAGAALEESDWYRLAMGGQAGWILPRWAPSLGPGPMLSYAAPVVSNGEIRGAVAVHIPRVALGLSGRPRRGEPSEPSPLLPAISPVTVDPAAAAAISSLQPSEYVILGGAGEIIYRSGVLPHAQTRPTAGREVARRAFVDAMRRARHGEGGVVRIADVGAELGTEETGAYWVAFAPIAATNWTFASAVSEEHVMAPMLREMAQRAGVLLLVTAGLGALVYAVAIRISRPIEQMAAAARRIGDGDLTARVPERAGRDEVAELGRVFNRMVHHIRNQMSQIREEAAAREAVESELRVARSIQADLLPRKFPPFPEHKEFALHGINLPARQVAGDFFDYFLTRQGKLLVVIADVSGKGVPAALLMAVTRTIIRNLSLSNLRPVEIVRAANRMLVEDTAPSMFVTLFLCEYDPESGEYTYVNAGHPSPFTLRADGSCRELGSSTAPLVGIEEDWPEGEFQEGHARLQPGESLVLYTDGVTEARDGEGRFFGEQMLQEALTARAGEEPERICHELISQVERYQEGSGYQDDITVVVLKRVQVAAAQAGPKLGEATVTTSALS